jgi:hypothetical protein
MYKNVIQRANKQRRSTDHIAWEGICTRCGVINKRFGDELQKEFGDFRVDLKGRRDLKCRRSDCLGRVKWYGRMPAEKAIHQNDIRRR